MLTSLVVALLAQSSSTLPGLPPRALSPDGHLSFEAGVLTPPTGATPGEAALTFATARRAELGVDPRSTLVVDALHSTRFGGTVRLKQQLGGVDVAGAGVAVTFDTLRRVVRVSSSLKPFAQALLSPRLTGDEALVVASQQVDGALLKPDRRPYGGYRPEVFLVRGDAHVGFLTFVPTLKAADAWFVAVDAVTGEVLWVQNKARAAAGDAKVYASSPGGRNAGVGVTPLVTVQLPHLGANADHLLNGERLRALNCCPTEVCDPQAAPRRATGMLQTFGGAVSYDVAICDRYSRATNDPALHASGDYVYAPVDPPTTTSPSITSPADYDEFAEVHAYYHANKAYDAVEAMSQGPLTADGGFSPFRLRMAGADLPAVWANASDPDFQSATQNPNGVYVSNTMVRTDNAMFVPREQMAALSVPEFEFDSDALVIYQGNTADFAYDGPVLWHEFGHGVIHSTANWDTVVSFDSRSANNESSALDEGMADILSAAVGNDPVVGAYVGPRLDAASNAIRDLSQFHQCPDVLWGESHQDSMHFTSAVWAARQDFLGADSGDTFDAAIYAALVSFPADVNFEKAAAIITASVEQAFPGRTDARAKLQAAFDGHGVTNCSKVLDVTNATAPLTYFGIAGTVFAGVSSGMPVPGPYQFKIHVPAGAKSVTMTGPYQTFGNTQTARLQMLVSADSPVTFVKNGQTIVNDAQVMVVPTVANQVMTGKATVAVPCGGDVYIAVANTSQRDRPLYDLVFSVEPADTCEQPVVDAGTPPPPDPVQVPVASDLLGAPAGGCGCADVPPLALMPALLLFVRRRFSRR